MLNVHNSSEERRQPRVVYVTPDCTDSAVQKRVRGFLDAGAKLFCFSFRRRRYNQDFVPDWQNIELGETTERRLFPRIMLFFRSLWIFFTHRKIWKRADLLYARNLDLAVVTLWGSVLTWSPAPLVYEVLDIHPALTKPGLRGSVLRWLERRVLGRCKLLVVSSPAFLENYFRNMQRYDGRAFVLENKWSSDQFGRLPRKLAFEMPSDNPVWTISWFGNLRCSKSLMLLSELADALPDRVRVYLRGCSSLIGEQKLLDAINQRDNMVFEGEYVAPCDLPEIYSKAHFNWCADFDDGLNSAWLLPNRLYEGGYFGIPALAIAEHETGRKVKQEQLGIVLQEPLQQNLVDLFANLTPEAYLEMRNHIGSLPASKFVDDGNMEQLLAQLGFTCSDRIVEQAGIQTPMAGVSADIEFDDGQRQKP